ncbi:DNA helicase [Tanacetum coccineum]
MLGAIVYEPGPETDMDYDIIVEERSGHPQRVNKLHSSYMSLQFPLLFPYGEDGYSKDLKLIDATRTSDSDKRLTMKAYYTYIIHDHANRYNYLSRTGRLFQQYVVTAFCAIEQNRIDYVREHQNDMRNEYLSGIYDAINRGDNDGSDCGASCLAKLLQCYTPLNFKNGVSPIVTPWARTVLSPAYPKTATYTSRSQIVVDEIKNYLDSRYIRPHEACWRMLEFDIHYREPAVQILSIHLQNMQCVIFRDKDRLDSVVVNAHSKKRTLTEWLYYNEWNTDGRHLTYLDFPSEFIWNPSGKYWRRRRQRHKSSIGRLTYVHPASDVLFYQRMLLCHQKGCRSFLEIQKVNDVVYPTCRVAGQALGLLEDDKEWENNIREAVCMATPAELRTLFAHMLTFCQVTNPSTLWQRVWRTMSEDITYTSSISLGIPNLHIDDSQLEDYTFDGRKELQSRVAGQRKRKVNGKVKRKEKLAKLIKETSLIIWDDEPPMNDRRFFETLDRTLRDILDKPNALFGGKSVMLGGDFRHTLPVKKNASRTGIIASSIAESYLWRHFSLHHLTKNMRLHDRNMNETERQKVTTFAKWLLDIGDDHLGTSDEVDPENASWVDIPDDYRIPDDENGTLNLIRFIYDDNTLQIPTPQQLQEKVIVCSKNEVVDIVNTKVMSMIPGRPHVYGSYDEALPHGHDGGEVLLLYPREYFNTLSFVGLLPHNLELKIGTPIILLRNINIVGVFCNGTRLIVKQLLAKVIKAQIIIGTRIGQKVYLLRIPLTMKPFIFKRKQFPIKICYAMTINKSQGQSLKKIGVYLP